MKFTRRTYRVAIRRSFAIEATLWSEHMRCFRGPDAWLDQMAHTNALRARRSRERRSHIACG